MPVAYIHFFLTALAFTVAVETALLYILLRSVFKNRIASGDIFFAGAFASFATIPYVWFVFPYATFWTHNASLLVSEPFAFVVEAFFYNRYLKLGWRVALVVSLICNAASFLLGRLLIAHGLWIYW